MSVVQLFSPQLAHPLLQLATVHAQFAQPAVPLVTVHTLPHAPQLSGSLEKSAEQVSPSACASASPSEYESRASESVSLVSGMSLWMSLAVESVFESACAIVSLDFVSLASSDELPSLELQPANRITRRNRAVFIGKVLSGNGECGTLAVNASRTRSAMGLRGHSTRYSASRQAMNRRATRTA
jgi:hypothetical protein